ncbi:hypothetical protein HanPSC8_Chr01g0002811 [Helianthus annuus]|nr:hypothetical protein HanPSC8_Chr01g0002811 [Helianthus annuus]
MFILVSCLHVLLHLDQYCCISPSLLWLLFSQSVYKSQPLITRKIALLAQQWIEFS